MGTVVELSIEESLGAGRVPRLFCEKAGPDGSSQVIDDTPGGAEGHRRRVPFRLQGLRKGELHSLRRKEERWGHPWDRAP